MNFFPNRSVCISCRIKAFSQLRQPCRNISAKSAINKGLRTTRDEGRSERGGRDRSKGFAARPILTRRDEARPKRASLSERVEKTDRERDRRSRDSATSGRPAFGGLDRRRAGFNRPAENNFPSRSQERAGARSQSFRESRTSGSVRRRDDSDVPSRPSRDARPSRETSSTKDSASGPRPTLEYLKQMHADDASRIEQPKGGILREIKAACRLIDTIQQRQAAGEGADHLAADLKSCLARVNSFTATASFREDPADAIADMMRKKASDGTFVRGFPGDRQVSVIFQRQDGALDVAIGRGGPTQPAKPSSEFRQHRDDEIQRAPRREREEPVDRPSRRTDVRQNRNEDDEDDSIPVSVPYTTAASEFLYGYNSVLAALRARRRKIYKLYIHPKIFERENDRTGGRDSSGPPAHELVSLAKEANIPFKNEFNTRVLDKMSQGRPHNGLVLEVSKIPAVPIVSLGRPDVKQSQIPVILGRQTAEEAAVNGHPTSLSMSIKTWRYPLVVLLDGITDPGNVGNILRTCHFYGVDAVAVAVNTCANLSSAVLAKASSGACEAVRLLSISQPSNFIFESSKFRWKVFAAVAPTADARGKSSHLTASALAADSPLAKHPCILMLGAEGEGLRENLKNRADHFLSIAGGPKAENTVDVGVDSMNVSVAAGVLLESFMRKPDHAPHALETRTELGF